jgi:nicotinate phosphoribosyltransferase
MSSRCGTSPRRPATTPLLQPVMRGRRPLGDPEPLAAIQRRCRAGLARLPPAARALHDPQPVPVRISDQLTSLQDRTARDIIQRTAAASSPGAT